MLYMNRKQRIVFSVVGITIVLLTLIGLTYAYYLTRIQGNTNEKSIDITSAYLALSYDDGNKEITMNNILPGTTITSKTFTVTNVGNATVGNYVVALENVINELKYSDDLVYTLKCTSNNAKSPCTSETTGIYPKSNQVLVHNSIAVKTTHTYELTITYKETGVDQSDDMGKNIEGKVQIYDARNIVDIDGTVTNASSGDYVELHSEVKKSSIDDESKYKIVGVFPGTHKIYIKDSTGNIKASREITIEKASNINVDLDKITINENTSNINLDLNLNNGELDINVEVIENPYKEDANNLNYNILNNAIKNKNRTVLSKTPLTNPGTEINKIYSYMSTYKELGLSQAYGINTSYQDYYWTYADNFTFDENTGKFSLQNPKTCKYSECYSNLSGKYVAYYNVGSIAKSTNTLSNYTNLNIVYKLNRVDAPDANRAKSVYYDLYIYKNIPEGAERTISITEDNDGNSYYFRGYILDNFVNFAGMCWRIVRINGDGTTRLILDDKATTCNSETYTGNFQYSTASYGPTIETLSDGTKVYKNIFLTHSNALYEKLKTFQTTKLNNYLDYLSAGKWCYDDRAYSDEAGTNTLSTSELDTYYKNKTKFYYAPYVRIVTKKSPSLKCEGTELSKYRDNTSMYVGTITADEEVFAGITYNIANYDNYLFNDKSIFQLWYWTLSPFYFDVYAHLNNNWYVRAAYIDIYGDLYNNAVNSSFGVRPSVNLKSNIKITGGTGIQSNPYVIN